ncbi:MAG: hypothetical protein COC23_03590 [Hyphomicrobiales bacterium]|nr:MAG: hypothetical protein COC23_03590 [Hyphomicrobiales bacterium]
MDKASQAGSRAPRKAGRADCDIAQIIIFPGVRYERMQENPTNQRKSRVVKPVSGNSKSR